MFDDFDVQNLRDGVLFSCYLDAAALVPVPSRNPSCPTNHVNNYRTDCWVQHSYHPPHGPSENYRLQHIPQTLSPDANTTFTIYFEEQTYDANINVCIRQTFYPELLLKWRGPILVMKLNKNQQPQNCNEADIPIAIEAVKQFVLYRISRRES